MNEDYVTTEFIQSSTGFRIVDINNLQKQNAELKEENERLKKNNNPLKGIFAQVTDDQLLRENGLLYAENKKLKNNWNELKSLGKERIENANKYLSDSSNNWDEDARGYVLARKFMLEEILNKMKELEEKEVE